jgi:hypothetical protein
MKDRLARKLKGLKYPSIHTAYKYVEQLKEGYKI